MLEDAHRLKQQGVDIVTGVIDTHGREETATLIGDLERVRMRRIQYRTVVIEEMDLEGVIERRPEVALVDDLAIRTCPGRRTETDTRMCWIYWTRAFQSSLP
jgi:two-component system sensor histidine kinase KdpD